MKKNLGFTLIEVMISMVIMAFLTVLISASIRTAVQNKKKIEARMESESQLYDSLRIIKMDIERAFHYQDVFWEIENLAIQQLEQGKGKGQGQAAASQSRQNRQKPVQLTQFLGEENRVDFTALNHFRTKYNAQESDQMEVGYFVDSCQKRDGSGSTRCLFRRVSTQIDDEVDKDGNKVLVVERVEKFSLKYRSNEENAQWVSQWRSDNKGRNDHRGKFPHLVQIELALGDPDDKRFRKVEQTITVAVLFPNNEKHLSQQTNTGTGAPAAAGAPQ